MKLSENFFYTIRENVKDEESTSGNLLVRSGMIKKSSTGIYMYMPLGLRVFKNIEKIIREEMNKAGALELLMPSLLPEEVYAASGRRAIFGDSMFGLQDRYQRNYVLAPTHEELFVEAAKQMVKSYKDMPFNLYQIGTKYRDEPRPRYGLIRVREFAMKDAYSFDVDNAGLDKSYQKMKDAYNAIFTRMGIDYKEVLADTGAMGGLLSEEFQAITEIGEDIVVLCDKCDYASNIEVSECFPSIELKIEHKKRELVKTPNAKTIKEVSDFLKVEVKELVKTLIYKADDKFYACLVPGDRDMNELKVRKLLKVRDLVLADCNDVESVTCANIGFAGPIGLTIPIICDTDVALMHNFVVGANQNDFHYINVNITDFTPFITADIANVKEGDACPKCKGKLYFKKGIEIGNIFKLGTKYSEALDLNYLDKNNKLIPAVMGSYGIGLGRIMAAIAEQKSDEAGIKWPLNIAPYQVGIVLINKDDDHSSKVANKLYQLLNSINIPTLLDDRDERPGVKFNDMDLIGLPIRVTVGKKAVDSIVELKTRDSKESIDVSLKEIMNKIKELIS